MKLASARAWMAQDLLSTFGTEIEEVALRPGTGGAFEIRFGDTLIWERAREGGFVDIKTLKRRVKDIAAPGRALGRADRG